MSTCDQNPLLGGMGEGSPPLVLFPPPRAQTLPPYPKRQWWVRSCLQRCLHCPAGRAAWSWRTRSTACRKSAGRPHILRTHRSSAPKEFSIVPNNPLGSGSVLQCDRDQGQVPAVRHIPPKRQHGDVSGVLRPPWGFQHRAPTVSAQRCSETCWCSPGPSTQLCFYVQPCTEACPGLCRGDARFKLFQQLIPYEKSITRKANREHLALAAAAWSAVGSVFQVCLNICVSALLHVSISLLVIL